MNPINTYIPRIVEQDIRTALEKQKVLVLYGARQVGKTTLVKNLFAGAKNVLYLSCDQTRIQEQIIPDALALRRIVGDYQTLIFDEAQYLDDPGLVLKILIDAFPEKRIIATGSSSFDLAHRLSEPLTGRHLVFLLFPFLFSEFARSIAPQDRQFHLRQSLLFGTYPEVFRLTRDEEKIRHVRTLTDAYLYKDILAFHLVKQSQKVRELLIAIALQIGNEVSYSELANTIGMDRKTVEHYIDLLEKSFVIFRLYGFSRNLRSEINRKVKIYFYDIGIRNALVNNFNTLSLRTDGGGIFENVAVAEIVKREANKAQKANVYFWRTYEQKEVDVVLEKNGIITAYEMKLHRPKKASGLSAFQKQYPGALAKIVTMDSFFEEFVSI